ncbi:MAG: fibronectin type III domain-containing protein, partial [Ruminococcus sp.]
DFIKKDKDRKEPVAITGTRFDVGSKKDTLFVEGIFYDFVSGGGDTVEQQIAGGRFVVRKKFTDSTGNNNTFIHLAQSASFVEDNRLTEQTLVVYGDEYSGDHDKIYLDIFWCYNDGTDITIKCTNDNYYDKKNEDDNGTFLTFCPLDVDNDTTYFQYTTKTVGWSNPQVHSVMLSVPYWSELDYGSALAARGSTYYSISTGVGSTYANSGNLSLGASIGIEGKIGFFATTAEGGFGANIDFMHQYLHSFQESNTVTETIGFTAGGGDDYVALLVMPIVTYHYKTWIPEHKATQDEVDSYLESYGEVGCPKVGDTIEGYFTDMCVSIQLNPANSTVPLKTYNQVVENFNKNEKDEYKLPLIDLDELYPGRKLGDPSTYADDIEKISSIDPDAETTRVTNNEVSVSINGKSTVDQSLTETYSSSSSDGYGFNIKASISETFEAGVHLLIFNAEAKVKCVESLGGGFSLTWASSNTNGITYKNTYASLPDSAKTGVENGTTVSSYAYSCKLVKWQPENIGNGSEITTVDGETLKVSTAVIGSLVSGADGAPAAMPTDLHVSSTTKDTATLRWNNNTNYARKADAYKIYYSKSATGEYYPVMDNGKEVVVDGDRESYVVKGLSEKTTYYFKLQTFHTVNEESIASVLGPYASGTTKGSSNEPLIVTPPSDVYTVVGKKAEFTIEATPEDSDNTLTYKWQQLVNKGYLSEWTDIASEEAKKPTFNAAYGSEDGLVSNTTAKTLDNTVYRCIVTEHYDNNNDYRSVISRSATLHIADHVYNDNGFCIYCDQYQPATLNNGVYEIKNAGQLFWFASLVNNDHTHAEFDSQDKNAKGVLKRNIDLENREWSPIKDFKGSFDGKGFTVSNFKINNTSDNSGLFGNSSGTIQNFTLKGDIVLSANGDKVGGVVGSADGGSISNVISYVNISNTDGELKHTGGVAGYIDNAEVTVDKCMYFGTINIMNSHDCFGGIVGYSNGGARISNCANHGTVSCSKQDAYVGGILGYVNNSNPTVKDCYNYGNVSNDGSNLYCGAIIGWARNYTSDNISNNYYLDSSATYPFGTGGKSGVTATPKTSEQFESGEVTYLLNHKIADESAVWRQNIDNGNTPDDYPVFEGGIVYYLEYKDDYSNINSSGEDEFDKDRDGNLIIKTYDDLVKVAKLVRNNYDQYGSRNYIVVNNIKAPDDSVWKQGIGSLSENKPFNGKFYGNGYCIIGLNIDCSKYGALFEAVGNKGTVQDLFVLDCEFNNPAETAGGVVAVNNGTVDHCLSGIGVGTGSLVLPNKEIDWSELNSNIKGNICGGIVGENNGLIIGCRNCAVVKGTQSGGIAGLNTGEIYGCANNGKISVTSTDSISGGLVGKNGGTIESSYNSGNVKIEFEKSTDLNVGLIAGINGYGKLAPIVKNVFYTSQSKVDKFGSASTYKSYRKITEKTADVRYDADFANELNAVTDKSLVEWTFNKALNKGYPKIINRYFNVVVIPTGKGITVTGSMHKDLNISYEEYNKDSEEYNLLTSSVDESKIIKAYSVSFSDKNGDPIHPELWCQKQYKISVPVESKDVQLAGMLGDGTVDYYNPVSYENGVAVFNVPIPMSFAVVEKSDDIIDSPNTDEHPIIKDGDSMVVFVFLAIAILSLTIIFVTKRRNRFE